MGSSFFEFNIATTGLFAAKAGLEVSSNNVANMATKGYSRQYIMQRATTPLDRYSGVGQVGTGTEVYGIGQHRDVYLDRKYWSQNSVFGEYSQKRTQLSMMETIFSSLSENGLTNNVNNFFSSISDLEFTANDLNYRSAVINNAETFVTNLKNHANKLRQQQIDVNDDIYALVQRINAIGTQIANLNDQIYRFEIDGHTANELRDQRTLLLDELSKYANVEVKEVPDTSGRGELGVKMCVLINGQELISHDETRKLNCVRRTDEELLHPNDAANLYNIVWENGDKLNLNGLEGELKGLIDIRDGDSGTGDGGEYKGIPYYINKLNEFVRTMARAFNEGTKLDGTKLEGVIGHREGFDLHGNKGGLFFTKVTNDGSTQNNITNPENPDAPITDAQLNDFYSSIDVFNFAVSDELKKDPSRLATSDSNNPDEESNNKVIQGFLKLKDDVSLFAEGGAYQFVNAISSTLGIDTKQAENFTKFYKDITTTVDNQRMQVSGVSLNEEVANIVKYQHLYQTASKLINTINEIYNTTINGLGI